MSEMKIEINEHALEAARRALEDRLVELRDMRVSNPYVPNGLVIRERNGDDSSTIRIKTADALRLGIAAYLAELEWTGDGR